jgi:hypothetical protein
MAGVYFWPTIALQAYFLQAHGNGELTVLGKLPYLPPLQGVMQIQTQDHVGSVGVY